MYINNMISQFAKAEDGAVTVDWVVLTAAVVGLGLLVMSSIRQPIKDLADDIATEIDKSSPLGLGGSVGDPK